MEQIRKERGENIREIVEKTIPNSVGNHYTFNENLFTLYLFEKDKVKDEDMVCFPVDHGVLNWRYKNYEGKFFHGHCTNYPMTTEDIEKVIKDCLEEFNK